MKSTVVAGKNVRDCGDGKSGNVKIARRTHTMNVAGVAASR
ncbi:MAG TPA: hypothetical protein VK557_16395 [Pyrinomonadaceae bacterium]|nr:hypothetical protein [Pyrinomonadaceae bacterium]